MARRIIDMHQHISEKNSAGAMAEAYADTQIEKVVLQGLPASREPANNETALQAAEDYPDLFIPFFGFDFDNAGPNSLDEARDSGFRGVKFIGPHKPYNHPDYFPVYERAAELDLPVLFHLGIVANKDRWSDCDSNLMRPIHLDHIARCHPNLRIVGAHLGNPWYDEATMSCRWNPNLYFDLSGSTLKKKSPEFLGSLLWWTPSTAYRGPECRWAWEKIVFGSDVPYSQVTDVLHDYEVLMGTLNLAPHLRESVWWDTAAKILKLED
ncbi:MAG: amidohydrolase family protein [Candidatus Brocadiia bacterium]